MTGELTDEAIFEASKSMGSRSSAANFIEGAKWARKQLAAEPDGVKLFKTTVIGVGPFCVEFADGEIVYTRSEARQRAIARSA